MGDSFPEFLVCCNHKQNLPVNIVAQIDKVSVHLLELLCHQFLKNFSDVFKFYFMNPFLECLVFLGGDKRSFYFHFNIYLLSMLNISVHCAKC